MGQSITSINIGTEPNAPLFHAMGMEHHLPIMRTLWMQGGSFDREIRPQITVIIHEYYC